MPQRQHRPRRPRNPLHPDHVPPERRQQDPGGVDAGYGNQAVQEQLRQQALDKGHSPEQVSQGQAEDKAVYTTGGPGSVTSTLLPQSGDWDSGDFRPHHSDRSNSWAANNIRNNRNQDLDDNGREVGDTRGVDLILPWPAKVVDIQKSFEGSGGYGKYLAVEALDTGLRFEVHHMDTVGDFSKGQELDGGTVIGEQGGSGNSRNQYAVHVDIVGTAEAVEQFVRANQQGTFTKRTTSGS